MFFVVFFSQIYVQMGDNISAHPIHLYTVTKYIWSRSIDCEE